MSTEKKLIEFIQNQLKFEKPENYRGDVGQENKKKRI